MGLQGAHLDFIYERFESTIQTKLPRIRLAFPTAGNDDCRVDILKQSEGH